MSVATSKLPIKSPIKFILEEEVPLSISVYDPYREDHASVQAWDYPWLSASVSLHLSPFINSTIIVVNEEADRIYDWSIGEDSFRGSSFNVMIPGVCDLSLRVREYDHSMTLLRSLNATIFVRYVRRELRQLSREDRESFFATARVLWDIPTVIGQQRYGSLYRGIDYFVNLHNSLAGAKDCDHMHDGLGFLTLHVALSQRFEQALQAVTPRMSLPYWDFTIDEYHARAKGGNGNLETLIFESEVWQPDWFGTADPDLHYITEGRWAFTRVARNVWNSTHNSYGFMRAPWNANPIEYVTRCNSMCGQSAYDFQGWPTCSSHYDMLANYSSLVDFVYALQVAPHGPVHVNIGGAFGCAHTFDQLAATFSKTELAEFKVLSFALVKNLYRLNLRACPQFCSVDAPTSECTCGCPSLITGEHNFTDFFNTRVIPSEDLVKVLQQMVNDETGGIAKAAQVVQVMCRSDIFLGDQLESGSPVDISFWPIHPAIERVWAWKKLHRGFKDESWTNASASLYGPSCAGHRYDDMIPFELFDWRDSKVKSFSNFDYYQLADPSQSKLPYIYADFAWRHCALDPYHLDFREF